MEIPVKSNAIGRKTSAEIKLSDKYSRFHMINGTENGSWNRKINKNNVDKLKSSMKAHGFIVGRPVLVYWDQELQKYVIVDGQHRFYAAMELEIEFAYTVACSKEEAMELAGLLNRHTANWSTKDYTNRGAMMGDLNCQILIDLSREYKSPISTVAPLLCGYISGGSNTTLLNRIKDGEFEAKDKFFAMRVLDILKRLANFGLKDHRNSRQLVSAVSKLCLVKKFDEDELFRKMEGGKWPHLCANAEQYMDLFEDIYNYRRPSENKLSLAKMAIAQAEKRKCVKANVQDESLS